MGISKRTLHAEQRCIPDLSLIFVITMLTVSFDIARDVFLNFFSSLLEIKPISYPKGGGVPQPLEPFPGYATATEY